MSLSFKQSMTVLENILHYMTRRDLLEFKELIEQELNHFKTTRKLPVSQRKLNKKDDKYARRIK